MWPSRKQDFIVPGTHGKEHFVVNNFEGTYAGIRSLGQGLTYSDNSVYSTVGIKVRDQEGARISPGGWASARRCRTTSR